MYFSRSTLIALFASPLLALAQSSANPFNIPNGGLSATAGTALNLSWKPTTSGTVSLILRSGASSDLAAGTYIAQNIQNSGSYSWTPSTQITRGSDYAIEIVDDTDSSQTNYTPYFVIDSSNTVAYSTSQISEGAPSATPSLSTASNTDTASATSGSASSSVTGSSASASASQSSASAASASATSASGSASSASATGSKTGSSSSMATSASSSGAAFQSTSASASSSASAKSTNAAPRATAAAGVMGLIALGALAL